MFRLCLLLACARGAAISTRAIVDDVDATLHSALKHVRDTLKVVAQPADVARLKDAPNLVKLLAAARDGTLVDELRRGERDDQGNVFT